MPLNANIYHAKCTNIEGTEYITVTTKETKSCTLAVYIAAQVMADGSVSLLFNDGLPT